ncbi:PHD finger protein rhinoceros [Trichonephila inaurata madagascariensis]|uniref:PHD finger protein rhinoceros n=1 Tax=Trichonephila inaurata madagascariensis TaxID=2747483 RepID=A0A8X6YFT2_9ARAC|nr:PHD finger protein rhinoceros [Trichonephila inaurata madagascariensis]
MPPESRTRSKASKAKWKKPNESEEDSRAYLSGNFTEPPPAKLYNKKSAPNLPSELYRKDFISLMNLPDKEQLLPEEYLCIVDSWKPGWNEKGVQVPVRYKMPELNVREIRKRSKSGSFKIPQKLFHLNDDEKFNSQFHTISNIRIVSDERTCYYDLDVTDMHWLKKVNQEREDAGIDPLDDSFVELVFESLEQQVHIRLQEEIKNDKTLGIDYDEDAICDVCRSPDSHESNKMVFCDKCNICVHQICYGITKIPEGNWLCRTCVLGIKPRCLLCPNTGGAMKSTRDGHHWAHVSCAVWIPEVSFLNFIKMEPITKIAQIPACKYQLKCALCASKVGVCITCSEKGCKVAFHVTCAFEAGLQMKANVKYNNNDDDELKAYCKKHSKKIASNSEEDYITKRPMTREEKNQLRKKKIEEKEAKFIEYVSIDKLFDQFGGEMHDLETIFYYWKVKRTVKHQYQQWIPKFENNEINGDFKFLTCLRFDLEKARNLIYQIKKREIMTKKWLLIKEQTFLKQVEILTAEKKKKTLTPEEREAVLNANFGNLDYDKKFTGENGPSPNVINVLTVLLGEGAANFKPYSCDKAATPRKKEQKKLETQSNPYAKHYLNGLEKRSERCLPNKQKLIENNKLSAKCKTNQNTSSASHDSCNNKLSIHFAGNFSASPENRAAEFNVSGDTSSSSLSPDGKFCSASDTKDSIYIPCLTESSSQFKLFSIKNHTLNEQENCNSDSCNINFIDSEISEELEIVSEDTKCEISNLGEIDLAADIKIEDSNIYLNEYKSESQNLEMFRVAPSKIVQRKSKSKRPSNRNRKRKYNSSKKSGEVVNGYIESELPVKRSKVDSTQSLSDLKLTQDTETDEQKTQTDFTLVPTDCHSATVKNELNMEKDVSDQGSANHVLTSICDVNSNDGLIKQISTNNNESNKNDADIEEKLVDVHNCKMLPRTLKVSLERNLELQMEQNNVTLPQPFVVLKSEDIVNCSKNINDVPNSKTCYSRKSDVSFNVLNCEKSQTLNNCDKSEIKLRPVWKKGSPVRTQSPTLIKNAENGLPRLSKSSPRHNSQDKAIIKSNASKQKYLNHSVASSSSLNVNKPPSSPSTKCQEKTLPSSFKLDVDSSDTKEISSKDKSAETPLPRKDMLRGYKIPKKNKSSKPEENSLDLKRGNSPLSPLPDITSSGKSGYHSNAKSSWRTMESRSEKKSSGKQWTTKMNGDSQQQSNSRIDFFDPELSRWYQDPNNFNNNQKAHYTGDYIPPLLPPPLPPFSSPWVSLANQNSFASSVTTYRPGSYNT